MSIYCRFPLRFSDRVALRYELTNRCTEKSSFDTALVLNSHTRGEIRFTERKPIDPLQLTGTRWPGSNPLIADLRRFNSKLLRHDCRRPVCHPPSLRSTTFASLVVNSAVPTIGQGADQRVRRRLCQAKPAHDRRHRLRPLLLTPAQVGLRPRSRVYAACFGSETDRAPFADVENFFCSTQSTETEQTSASGGTNTALSPSVGVAFSRRATSTEFE